MIDDQLFQKDGYYLSRGLFSIEKCDRVREAFYNEIKPSNKKYLRQRNVKFETHRFSSDGFMENALLDIHRIDQDSQSPFGYSVEQLFSDIEFKRQLNILLGEKFLLLQTMYFESSKSTPDHFDHFFLRNVQDLPIIGTWIALEDIPKEAGRFYVYPESHLLFEEGNRPEIADLMSEYSYLCNLHFGEESKIDTLKKVAKGNRILQNLIEEAALKRYIPEMKKGDVLFFSSKTLHGSDYPQGGATRNSCTAHFLPCKGTNTLKYGSLLEKENPTCYAGYFTQDSKRYTILASGN